MAFTTAQAFQIRHYLGFPSVGVDRYLLDSLIETVGNDALASAEAISLLAQISELLTKATSADVVATSGIKSVDKGDVVFQDGASAQLAGIRAAGRMLVNRLSLLFALVPMRDIFSGAPMGGAMCLG